MSRLSTWYEKRFKRQLRARALSESTIVVLTDILGQIPATSTLSDDQRRVVAERVLSWIADKWLGG